MSRRSSRYYYEKAGRGAARRALNLPSLSNGASGCVSQIRDIGTATAWAQSETAAVTGAAGDSPDSFRAVSPYARGNASTYPTTALVSGVLVPTGGYYESGRVTATLGGNTYRSPSMPVLNPGVGPGPYPFTARDKVTQYLAANPGTSIDRWVLAN